MQWKFETATRGYIMDLSTDLFGAFVLRRRWYGRRNRRGGAKEQIFVTEEEARREVDRVCRVRQRRGYTSCAP